MLVYANRLIGTPILSMQAAAPVGQIYEPIVDPDSLKIIAFYLVGSLVDRNANILDVKSVREYSVMGMVVDSADEFVGREDVIRIEKVVKLNFSLVGLKVETKKGTKLGRVVDFTITSEDFMVQQIIVKRPLVKSFLDPELIIPRREIVEVTDEKLIVKDEEDAIKRKAETTEFIPNFVNPFRKTEQVHAKERNQNLDDIDIE